MSVCFVFAFLFSLTLSALLYSSESFSAYHPPRSRFLFSAHFSYLAYHGYCRYVRRARMHRNMRCLQLLLPVLDWHLDCVGSLTCSDANGSYIVDVGAYMPGRRVDGARVQRRGCFRACAAPRWWNSQTQGLWELAFMCPTLTSEESRVSARCLDGIAQSAPSKGSVGWQNAP